MSLKSLTALMISGLVASSFAFADTVQSTTDNNTNSTQTMPVAPTDNVPDTIAPAPLTPAPTDSAEIPNSAPSMDATNNSMPATPAPTDTNPAPTQNNDVVTPAANSDEAAPDTATGDDDY